MTSAGEANPSGGAVYLVGAGPGDPRLVTVKGLELLRACDVVVYDTLIADSLLDEAPAHALRIPVGKRPGGLRVPQDAVNRTLIEHAAAGRRVVRLKGGDPFVFGRGAEEAAALAAAGVRFEVVPGVTSPVAVASYAGIPLTHRDLTPSFAVVTGHRAVTGEPDLPWEHLARGIPTLVFLMGVAPLAEIARRLIEHGRPPHTPVAVIEWGTTARQRTVAGTLATIDEQVRAAGIASPAIAIVGEVVRLRERIAWFERLPLFGRNVIVTRDARQAGEFESRLRALGADVLHCPTIRIEPLRDTARIDDAIAGISRYQWLVFTSINGVDCFWPRLDAAGLDSRALAPCRVVAVGSATAAALAGRGIRADLVPDDYQQEGILSSLEDHDLRGAHILFPRAEKARALLEETLRARGADVDAIPIYRTVDATRDEDRDRIEAAVEQGGCILTFASSSAVRHLAARLGESWPACHAGRVTVAVLGAQTRETAEALGFQVQVQPERATIPDLVDAIVAFATRS